MLSLHLLLLPLSIVAALTTTTCTNEQKKAAIEAEIKTIGSHSAADAAKIPLTPLASRTFYVTPSEGGTGVTAPVNVGFNAATVRAELVALATALDASVPTPPGVTYTFNGNGSVTSDFIQINRGALPYVSVREIHDFDTSSCAISKIVGYVHGNALPDVLVDWNVVKGGILGAW